jgi:hypothetical protein
MKAKLVHVMEDIDSTVFEHFPCNQFVYCSWMPIRTSVHFSAVKRSFVHHNNSCFIWVNGTELELPYLIIPLRESDKDELYEYSKSKIYDDALDYLSLLSVIEGLPVDIDINTFKNYYGKWDRVLEYHPPFIPRVGAFYTGRLEKPPICSTICTEKHKQILGLFREACSSNSIFYSIMACYKVFENFMTKDEKIIYFNENLEAAERNYMLQNKIRGFGDIKKFKAFVKKSGLNIADYIYDRCRHPIAHSKPNKHFIKPFKYSDYYEMYYANEAMKALTLYLIMDKIDIAYIS